MKRLISILLAIVLLLCLTSCKNKKTSEPTTRIEMVTVAVTDSSGETVTDAQGETVTEAVTNKNGEVVTEVIIEKPTVSTKPNSDSIAKSESSITTNKSSTTKKGETTVKGSTTIKSTTTTKTATTTKKSVVTTTTTAADANDIKRKQLQNTYGVTIQYGSELGSYKPQDRSYTKLTDPDKISECLSTLGSKLKNYPVGFFKEMKNNSCPITICLIDSVENDAFYGFTDSEFWTDIKMTFVDEELSYTFDHETMHYVDKYMNFDGMYEATENLNPAGYKYEQECYYTMPEYNFNYATNSDNSNAYFLGDYAQMNVREDRAETFRTMMRFTSVYKFFNSGSHLNKKAKVISDQIESHFDCVSGDQYWDRLIE